MSEGVWVVGVATTRFKRWPERDHSDLAEEALAGALADAGLADGGDVGRVWFGNCGMHHWGQGNVRGQVALADALSDGRLNARAPVINVEGGCATGSMALHGAVADVRAGHADLALALGVEKTFMPTMPERMMALFDGALDQLKPDRWGDFYRAAAEREGLPYRPHPARIQLLDVCAMQAMWHMRTHGTSPAQIAASAAKNHGHSVHNPNAQYRKAMSAEEVLADKPVIGPLTRAMCAPISDGAAAVLVVNARGLAALPKATRARAVAVIGSAQAGGTWRSLGEPSVARHAGDAAYAMAGVGPDDIDVVELHDATSFAELHLSEMLRFCDEGQGGAYVASGAATLGGERPANLSGGLVSKGHPLGASGLAMVHELATQLRGEAGARQVRDAHVALAENGGGLIGFDEAACAVTILRRA